MNVSRWAKAKMLNGICARLGPELTENATTKWPRHQRAFGVGIFVGKEKQKLQRIFSKFHE